MESKVLLPIEDRDLEKIAMLLIESASIDELIQERVFWKTLAELKGTLVEKTMREKLIAHFKCETCNNRGELTSFQRRFCERCLETHNSREITEEDAENSKTLICLKCFNKFDKEFYIKSTCMHLCAFCTALEVEKNYAKCRICSIPYSNPNQIKQVTSQCYVCSAPFPNLDIYQLKCRCNYCDNCIGQLKKAKVCIVCKNKSIQRCDFYGIRNRKKVVCEICEDVKDLREIKKKGCCEIDVCTACNGSDRTCKGCGSN